MIVHIHENLCSFQECHKCIFMRDTTWLLLRVLPLCGGEHTGCDVALPLLRSRSSLVPVYDIDSHDLAESPEELEVPDSCVPGGRHPDCLGPRYHILLHAEGFTSRK